MKIVSYDPNNIENFPIFFNNEIEKYKLEEDYDNYIMFIFENIFNEAINKETLIKSYKDLMEKFDLPYAFYPYNLHFNKVFKEYAPIPHPNIHGVRDGYDFDIVSEPSFGMLVLNLNKLNNFKFNQEYQTSFYIQDLIFHCKDKNLYLSEAFFFDVHESWKLFKTNFTNGFKPNVKSFKAEKEMFFSTHQNSDRTISEFIEKLKNKFNPETDILKSLSDDLHSEDEQ